MMEAPIKTKAGGIINQLDGKSNEVWIHPKTHTINNSTIHLIYFNTLVILLYLYIYIILCKLYITMIRIIQSTLQKLSVQVTQITTQFTNYTFYPKLTTPFTTIFPTIYTQFTHN
jgi:hypothetical protein